MPPQPAALPPPYPSRTYPASPPPPWSCPPTAPLYLERDPHSRPAARSPLPAPRRLLSLPPGHPPQPRDLDAATVVVGGMGVGVLQVLVVGPQHGLDEAAGGVGGIVRQQSSSSPSPLLHCLAPPLLLLPAAVAAEVCGLWKTVQLQQEQQLQHQGAQLDGGQQVAVTAEAEAEALSAAWWSHMDPLLCDVGYILTAMQQQQQQGEGNDGTARVVIEHVLPHMYGNGMAATADLLRTCRQQGPCSTPLPADGCGPSGVEHNAPARPLPASPSNLQPNSCLQPGASSPSPLRATVGTTTPSTSGAAAASAQVVATPPSHARGPLPTQPTPVPSSRFRRPFAPPSQEAAFQAWRLQGLATNAPYIVALNLYFAAIALARAVVAGGGAHVQVVHEDSGAMTCGAGGGGGGGWRALGCTAVVALVKALSDVGALVVLSVLVRRVRRQQQQQHGAGGSRKPRLATGAGGAAPSTFDVRAALRAYRLVSCFAGPALFVLTSVLGTLGLTRLDGRIIGDSRLVYGSCFTRGILVPSLQKLGVGEAAAAAVVLGLGEALWLSQLQPGWSWAGMGAFVGRLRVLAVVVSAAWEWRARRRFIRQAAGGGGRVVGGSRGAGGSGQGCAEGESVGARGALDAPALRQKCKVR